MQFSWDDSRQAFSDAAEWFVQTVPQVGVRWDQPGLGEWDVRALVGHTSRSFLTVESYLDRPASTIEITSAVEYVRATRAMAAGPAVAARGREAGAALGPTRPLPLRRSPAGCWSSSTARTAPSR
jgi:hypothetical protein